MSCRMRRLRRSNARFAGQRGSGECVLVSPIGVGQFFSSYGWQVRLSEMPRLRLPSACLILCCRSRDRILSANAEPASQFVLKSLP